MNGEQCHIIVNPAAGGGRTGQLLPVLRPTLHSTFGNDASVYVTKMPGDARGSAREAVRDGSRLIVVVGGDGTIYEAVNGICSLPPALTRNVTLAVISTGTGCGLARSLGIPATIQDQIAVACDSSLRAIDLGKLHLMKAERTLFFVNECQIGIGAEVVRRTRRGKKALGGSLTYALVTVPLLFSYPNPELVLVIDNAPPLSLHATGISIGNGAITGGGMHLTPHAVLDDGLIDVLVMKGQSPFHRVASFARVRSGNHVRSSRFTYQQVRRIEISSPSKLPVSADGEIVGNLPATFEVLPLALQIHCPTEQRREVSHEHISSAA